jgi:hypothetical protein
MMMMKLFTCSVAMISHPRFCEPARLSHSTYPRSYPRCGDPAISVRRADC